MWKKFLRLPGVRTATHPEMTTIQLPTTAGRGERCQAERAAELAAWAARMAQPGGHEWLQQEVAKATRRDLERAFRRHYDDHLEVLPALRQRVTELEAELDSMRTKQVVPIRELRVQLARAKARLTRELRHRREQ
jgi:hypothetical protein